ncbi:MAG: hypothetical protein AB7G28_07840 [Pirellulales bacterium]
MPRKLRIAASLIFGLLAVLMCIPWNWLYWRDENWAFACTFAIMAFAPWAENIGPAISPRFSLRTLLLATTLLAVVLGLGVWLTR